MRRGHVAFENDVGHLRLDDDSIGRITVITRGMPLVLQVTRMFSPWPPLAWSARLASKIALYPA